MGVAYVYAPAPADVALVGNLDSVSGVTRAARPAARRPRLAARGDADRSRLPVRPRPAAAVAAGAAGLALVVVAVLAAPTRKARR